MDKEGHPVKEIRFETGIKVVHNQFRQIEKTKRNTYLIPLFGSGELIEMNVSGRIINRVEVGGTPFSVKQLKRGKRLLVGCGDGHRWVEIDTKTWKIERSVTSDDLEGLSLLFVAELSRYGDGTTKARFVIFRQSGAYLKKERWRLSGNDFFLSLPS